MSSEAEETARRLLRSAEADQNEAGMTAIGSLASTLYGSLIAGNVPAALAATLTRDWFYLQLSRSLWPEQVPSPPFWNTQEWGEE